jgi:hypothetical protein
MNILPGPPSTLTAWSPKLTPEMRLEQFKLVYDYIKFHLGLYLATPPVFAVVAEGFNVNGKNSFLIGLGAMIVTYIISGADAANFMGRHINTPWDPDFLGRVRPRGVPARKKKDASHLVLGWGLVRSGRPAGRDPQQICETLVGGLLRVSVTWAAGSPCRCGGGPELTLA